MKHPFNPFSPTHERAKRRPSEKKPLAVQFLAEIDGFVTYRVGDKFLRTDLERWCREFVLT